METDQILDLFNVSSGESAPLPDPDVMQTSEENAVDAEGNVREKGKKGFLDDIDDLWDEKQYEEEHNLDSFLATLRS
jgi:TATA-binding protein-associated factor